MPAVKDFLLTIYEAATRPKRVYRDLTASPRRHAQGALVGALVLLLVLLGMLIANLTLPGGDFFDASTALVEALSGSAFLPIIAGLAVFTWIAPLVSRNRPLAWSAFWLSLSPALLIAGIASPFLVLGLALGWVSPAGVALPLLAAFNPIFYVLVLTYLWLAGDAISALGLGGWAAILVVVFQSLGSFRSLYAGVQELNDSEQLGSFGTLLLRLLVLNALWGVLWMPPNVNPLY
jgi:hypothetical protein